jgi:hypothetical protein
MVVRLAFLEGDKAASSGHKGHRGSLRVEERSGGLPELRLRGLRLFLERVLVTVGGCGPGALPVTPTTP